MLEKPSESPHLNSNDYLIGQLSRAEWGNIDPLLLWTTLGWSIRKSDFVED